MGYEQLSLFDVASKKIRKHIRLIELFAGIGAQAKALEILKADFEHWRTCEWSWKSIFAYNAIHMGGKTNDTSNLTYDEVLERIDGVSHDYNVPMTKDQLRKKGEPWARELLGKMMANHNLCPNISKLHAEDLDIREREKRLLPHVFVSVPRPFDERKDPRYVQGFWNALFPIMGGRENPPRMPKPRLPSASAYHGERA